MVDRESHLGEYLRLEAVSGRLGADQQLRLATAIDRYLEPHRSCRHHQAALLCSGLEATPARSEVSLGLLLAELSWAGCSGCSNPPALRSPYDGVDGYYVALAADRSWLWEQVSASLGLGAALAPLVADMAPDFDGDLEELAAALNRGVAAPGLER
jgi:hypothetical protein